MTTYYIYRTYAPCTLPSTFVGYHILLGGGLLLTRTRGWKAAKSMRITTLRRRAFRTDVHPGTAMEAVKDTVVGLFCSNEPVALGCLLR